MPESTRRTRVFMDTLVTVETVGGAGGAAEAAAARAFTWFAEVEARCNRFDPRSELRQLAGRPRQPVRVTELLWQALRVARTVARRSGGAFDPTIGAIQEARGIDRDYRSGRRRRSGINAAAQPSWRDLHLDPRERTVTLRRPALLDLGAVAKGLALDLAARELVGLRGFVVEAGGDLVAGGVNADGRPWRIGIRHPERPGVLLRVLDIRDGAVCTSAGDARPAPDGGHHLLDPRSGRSPDGVVSCTVLAPHAVLADPLSTAAFVMGPRRALPWLARQGVEGLLVTSDLRQHATAGFDAGEACA